MGTVIIYRIIMLVMFTAFCLPARLQLFATSPACQGMEAYSINHADVFSVLSNTASLAQLKSSSVGLISERRFLLSELNSVAAVLGLIIPQGKFALKTLYAGFNALQQTQVGLAYARTLGQDVDAGIQFSYHGFQVSGYGAATGVSVGAGVVFHATEKLNTGISINIPAGSGKGSSQPERWPAIYRFGVGYETSPVAFVSAEIEKEENQRVNARVGIRYQFHPLLLVKGGITTATSSVWSGVGFIRPKLHIDVSVCYHPVLGISPVLSLQFIAKEKQREK